MTIATAAARFAAPRPGKLRVAFVGATSFGRRCFARALALPEVEGAGVLSAPRTFPISYRPQGVTNVRHDDLGAFAADHGLPFLELSGKMTDPALAASLSAWRPDLFLVVGWYHMIPRSIRSIAPALGLHASLLPDYSGGAPLVWAIINGERRTGITLFEMDDGVDSGPTLGQAAEPIEPDDTIATLYARIEEAGIELIAEHLPRLARGEARFTAQDQSRRRFFPQRGPEDGLIDWSWPASRIHDFVRAQTRPYPGAFTTFGGSPIHVWATRPGSPGRIAPPRDVARPALVGTIRGVAADGASVQVACGGESILDLVEISVEGYPVVPAEWFRSGPSSAGPWRLGS